MTTIVTAVIWVGTIIHVALVCHVVYRYVQFKKEYKRGQLMIEQLNRRRQMIQELMEQETSAIQKVVNNAEEILRAQRARQDGKK